MAWTKLDDGIYDNPKILAVEPTDRLLYVWALCWSNRHHTDGVIPAKMLRYVALFAGCNDQDAAASRLVEAGLWENDADGWLIHDFAEYQLSAERVEDIRAKRAEAGRRGGRRSAEARRTSNAEANSEANAPANQQQPTEQTGKRNRTPSRPVPSPVTDVSSSSGTARELSTGPTDDDDQPPIDLTEPDTGAQALARSAAVELGRRDSANAQGAGVAVAAPARHAMACADTRWAVQSDELLRLARDHPELTPAELADLVDPDPARAAHPAGRASPPTGIVEIDGQRRFAHTLTCPTCTGRTDHGGGTCPLADPGDPTP